MQLIVSCGVRSTMYIHTYTVRAGFVNNATRHLPYVVTNHQRKKYYRRSVRLWESPKWTINPVRVALPLRAWSVSKDKVNVAGLRTNPTPCLVGQKYVRIQPKSEITHFLGFRYDMPGSWWPYTTYIGTFNTAKLNQGFVRRPKSCSCMVRKLMAQGRITIIR